MMMRRLQMLTAAAVSLGLVGPALALQQESQQDQQKQNEQQVKDIEQQIKEKDKEQQKEKQSSSESKSDAETQSQSEKDRKQQDTSNAKDDSDKEDSDKDDSDKDASDKDAGDKDAGDKDGSDDEERITLEEVRQEVKGEVISVRTSNLRGERSPHVLAKIKQDDDKTVILDLGPTHNLSEENVRLSEGTKLHAQGQPGRINDRPVLIVDRMLADGQFTMLIPLTEEESRRLQEHKQELAWQKQMQDRQRQDRDRREQQWAWQQQQQQQQQQPQRGQRGESDRSWSSDASAGYFGPADRGSSRDSSRSFGPMGSQQQSQQPQQQQQQRGMSTGSSAQQSPMVVGRIVDLRKVQLRGVSDRHNMAKVELSSGRTIIVDLGTQDVTDLRLDRGQQIVVSGNFGRINGTPVLFAEQVGDLVRIDRSRDASNQSQQSQSQSQSQQQRQSDQSEQDRSWR